MAMTQTFGAKLPMRGRVTDITYWAVTGLFALMMTASGIIDITHSPEVISGLARLGYPAYLATILGMAKLAGVLAVVLPVRSSLKEWAYAGFAFDLLGAAISHTVIGDPMSNVATIGVVMLVGSASYVLWRRRSHLTPALSQRERE